MESSELNLLCTNARSICNRIVELELHVCRDKYSMVILYCHSHFKSEEKTGFAVVVGDSLVSL